MRAFVLSTIGSLVKLQALPSWWWVVSLEMENGPYFTGDPKRSAPEQTMTAEVEVPASPSRHSHRSGAHARSESSLSWARSPGLLVLFSSASGSSAWTGSAPASQCQPQSLGTLATYRPHRRRDDDAGRRRNGRACAGRLGWPLFHRSRIGKFISSGRSARDLHRGLACVEASQLPGA